MINEREKQKIEVLLNESIIHLFFLYSFSNCSFCEYWIFVVKVSL